MNDRQNRTSLRSTDGVRRGRPAARRSRSRRGMAILLVIVAVAAAAVIGSAYVASRLNAPQVVLNTNAAAQARYVADSGADLATAIMECKTIDWRSVQTGGVLVDALPIGSGSVTIRVSTYDGDTPDGECEYSLITSSGSIGTIKQVVSAQAYTPLPTRTKEEVSVDLREFAVFGASSINCIDGWILRWNASPIARLGLPVNIGTNATVLGSIRLDNRNSAPDGRGFVMASAALGVIADDTLSYVPIPRVNFSINETVLLPAPPTPSLGGLTWSAARNPNVTANTSIVSTGDKRYGSLTIDGARLAVDLGGVSRTMGISGNLSLNNGAILSIQNGHLDLVVQGALNMFNASTIELGTGATMRIFLGGTMSIEDSVIGMPSSETATSRDARQPIQNYYSPQACTIYRITTINSVDLNLLDLDDAASWVWSDAAAKSWIIANKAAICARIYGRGGADISLNSRAAVYGNVVGRSVIIGTEAAVYYDHTLDLGIGYTNPDSRLYAAPMDLRDDIRLLLTDLNTSTLDAILALLSGGGVVTPVVPGEPTPRDKALVKNRSLRQYGLQVWRERKWGGEYLAEGGGN